MSNNKINYDEIIKELKNLVKFSSMGQGLVKFYNTWIEDNKLYLVVIFYKKRKN